MNYCFLYSLVSEKCSVRTVFCLTVTTIYTSKISVDTIREDEGWAEHFNI